MVDGVSVGDTVVSLLVTVWTETAGDFESPAVFGAGRLAILFDITTWCSARILKRSVE